MGHFALGEEMKNVFFFQIKCIRGIDLTLQDGALSVDDRLSCLALPETVLGTRERIVFHALRLHLNTVSRLRWCNIVPVLDGCRMQEMLMQTVNVLQNTLLAADNDVIDCAKMLCVLRQANTTRVRNDLDAKLAGQQQDGEDLVDTADTASIWLQDGKGTCLEELLEDNTVLAHLTGGNTDGAMRSVSESLANSGVTKDIIGGSRLLDEPRLVLSELSHVGNGLRNRPDLYIIGAQVNS